MKSKLKAGILRNSCAQEPTFTPRISSNPGRQEVQPTSSPGLGPQVVATLVDRYRREPRTGGTARTHAPRPRVVGTGSAASQRLCD